MNTYKNMMQIEQFCLQGLFGGFIICEQPWLACRKKHRDFCGIHK